MCPPAAELRIAIYVQLPVQCDHEIKTWQCTAAVHRSILFRAQCYAVITVTIISGERVQTKPNAWRLQMYM